MHEQTKATKRRLLDPRFANRWFVGDGIDIGCGGDGINIDLWPNINSMMYYDRELDPSHNAETMPGVDDEQFDFVHSSHCLEHMVDWKKTLETWLQLLKPGGFLICTVPDFVLYENCQWPSRNNSDHKWMFTMCASNLYSQFLKELNKNWKHTGFLADQLVHLPAALYTDSGGYDVEIPAWGLEHITLLTDLWNPALFGTDQTLGDAECAIEFVLQKALPDGQLFRAMVLEEETPDTEV